LQISFVRKISGFLKVAPRFLILFIELFIDNLIFFLLAGLLQQVIDFFFSFYHSYFSPNSDALETSR